MSKDDFIEEIKPKIQEILRNAYPGNKPKQTIKVHYDRISFAAPCCGDSAHNNYKKRGNIILEGKFMNLYKCFNCGTCMSVQNFLRQYGQDMSMSMIDYIASNKVDISSFRVQQDFGSLSHIYDNELIESLAIDRDTFRTRLSLVECTQPCNGRNYLINRQQYDFSKFMYSVSFNKLFILNLTPSGKIFGMQVRSFSDKSAKYKTYGLQKIHEMIFNDDVKVPDDINELSMIFNILLIDYNKYVTVTEGPMDSFLIRNSIALCGAGKHIEFPFMVRYLFDDDKPGREHAIEKLQEGYQVFMWEKYRKDIGMPAKKKIDMNDVVIWCKKNNVIVPSIEDGFSDNEFDLINI
jgi:hypothetical protein